MTFTAMATVRAVAVNSAMAVNPLIPLDDLAGLSESLVERALQGEAFDWIDRLGEGLLVRSGVPIHSTFGAEVVGVADNARVTWRKVLVEVVLVVF